MWTEFLADATAYAKTPKLDRLRNSLIISALTQAWSLERLVAVKS